MKKEALFGLITDTHLDLDTIEENLSVFKQSIEICKKLNIPLIHGGDIFESRKAQPLDVLNTFGSQILSLFQEADLDLYIIPGNHDKVNYESEDSYLDEFRYHPKVKLIRDHGIFTVKNNLDFCLHLIPFFQENTIYINYLNLALESFRKAPKAKHILITHIGVDQVKGNGGNIVKNHLSRSDFKKFFKVFIGHYHDKQEIGGNIYYTGSTDPRGFGEDNNKGITIFYNDGTHELINLNFSKYLTYEFDLDSLNFVEIEEYVKKYSSLENYIRFKFLGSLHKLKGLDIHKIESAGIKVKLDRKDIEEGIQSANHDEFNSFDKDSILINLEEFSELNGLKEEHKFNTYIKNKLTK